MHMIRYISRRGLCALAALLTMPAANQSVADQHAAIVLQVPRETAQQLRRTLPPSDDDPLEVLGFDAPTRIVGDVNVTLSVSSSARDTDIIVRLADVYPDGRSFNLTETGRRMRYRSRVDKPTLMQEGKIYEATVTGMVTAIQLAPGHRLRVQVTSSNSRITSAT
jgi:putative CocE/NonD family hydrolase